MPIQSPQEILAGKIADRSVHAAVVGLGYAGLPLAQTLVRAGIQAVGFDTSVSARERAEGNGVRVIGEPELADADVIIVCVPTPLGPHGEPDLGCVIHAGQMIRKRISSQLVILESTTYPGTTRREFYQSIRHPGVGTDWFLAYSPEREDPGSHWKTHAIPKLVGGIDEASGDLAESFYRVAFDRVVRCSSAEVAEAAKIHENIFRAVNIALVNELKLILERMDIDVWEVIEAASTKPFGFMPFYPGPGIGGHCVPVDPFYLAWKAREHGTSARFIELAGEINRAMPGHVVAACILALSEDRKPVNGSSIVLLGTAYKPDVHDRRESPGVEILETLKALGARVHPYDETTPEKEIIQEADLVVITSDHHHFDWDMIATEGRIIVDTRNALRRRSLTPIGRLILA